MNAPEPLRARPVLGAAAILLLFQLALFLPYVFSDELFFPMSPWGAPPWGPNADHPIHESQDRDGSDKLSFNYPNVRRWLREVDRDPEALLWNPDNFCGISFLATQNTHVLYPLNAVFLIFGPDHGMLATAILHGWLASLFAWMALRRVVRDGPALVGAAVYGGGGWFLAHHDMIQFAHSAAWVPLMFLGADRAAARRGPSGPALLAFGFALSFLGGMPQITVLGLLAAGIACAWRLGAISRAAGGRVASRGFARACCGVLLGIALSAPQLLPTMEIRADSARSRMPLEEMHGLAGGGLEFAEAVMPGVLGDSTGIERMVLDADDPEAADTFRSELYKRGFTLSRANGLTAIGHTFPERVMYPGMAALLLALAAACRRPSSRTALAWILILLGGLTMTGTAALDALYKIPAFQFANPRRFVFLVVIGMALLSAIGCERLTGPRGLRRPLIAAAAIGASVLALLVVVIAWPAHILDAVSDQGADDPQATWTLTWLRMHATRALLLIGASAAGFWVATRSKGRWAIPVVLILLAADLSWFNQRTNPGQDGTHAPFPETDIVRWLREQRGDIANDPAPDGSGLFRIIRYKNPATNFPGTDADVPPLTPNLNLIYEIQDVQGYEAVTDRHVEELMELVEPDITLQHHLLQELKRPESLASPILDLLGARYVLSPARSLPGCSLAPLPPEWLMRERVAVHARPAPAPRFQTPPRVRIVEDEDAVKAVLGAANFDPREEAVVLSRDAEKLGLAASQGSTWVRDGPPAKIEVVSYRPTRVSFRYEATVPTAVLVADTFHPGWSATSGGDDLPLVRADHALRMVLLPAGRGTLHMTFMPHSLLIGAAI
ncbi:MAG: hypothetical protein VX913_13850, partial [Planctomycetota bacterium]|nr:hypothetical protein [Planctomycetota bacterium]